MPSERQANHKRQGLMMQKPIQPLLASSSSATPPSVPDLLSISQSSYTSKVKNKAINFKPGSSATTDEAKAVKGRKRNRGDPDALEAARKAAGEKEETRRKLGIPNRKKRKRAVIDAGAELS